MRILAGPRCFFPIIAVLAGSLFGTTRYIAQSAGTFTAGAACNGQTAITPAMWNATPESPGDISYVCGTINAAAGATVLSLGWSGTASAPIQLIFDTNAVIQSSHLSATGGIVVQGQSWVTIDGGVNGTIQNTLNGAPGQICPGGTCSVQSDSSLVFLTGCRHCAVQNLNIASVYVRGPGDTHQFGSGITVANGGISGESDVLLANNTIANAYAGILWLYGVNESGIEIKANTISHTNWGIALRAPAALATVTGVTIHDNNIHDQSNWDDYPSPYNNHHDGILIFGNVTGNAVSGCYVYNNYFYGSFGSGDSPGLFLANVSTGTFTCTAFNNLIVPSSIGPAGMGGLTAQNESSSGPVHLIAYNNTIDASPASNNASGIWIQGASMATTVENNVISGWNDDLIAQSGAAKPSSNYNVWYNGAAALFNLNSVGYLTLPAWQSASGQDSNSISADPLLDLATWVPGSGSPAMGLAANLSSLCAGQPNPGIGALCFDKNGDPRPSSGNWDAGAYQYGSIVLQTPGLDGFFCSPTSVSPSIGSTCKVELSLSAGSGGTTINLSSSPVGVNMPPTVTVPQGSTSATFPITAESVATTTPVTLTAALGGVNEPFSVVVNPPAATLNGISVSPDTIVSGQSGSGTISLTAGAPAGGAVVTLSSSNPSVASVPSSSTVLPGASSATFPVTTGSVNVSTPVTLTASYSGVSDTFGLTVDPVPAALSSVSVSPGNIISGQSGTGTVNLTASAPAGGAVVSLSSSNPSAAIVPPSVTIPQGSTSATFAIGAGSVTSSTPVTLTAGYSGVSTTFGFNVNPPPDFSVGISPNSETVAAGASTTFKVTVTPLNGFGGVVTCGTSGLPSGVTGSFSPPTIISSGSTTLTIQTTGSASPGGVPVTATCISGSLNHAASASVNIVASVQTAPPLAPVSVTPNTGSGASQTFAFVFSDSAGAFDIASAQVDIASTLSVSGACYVYYPRALNELYLASDSGVWQGPIAIGSAGTLHNSQCTLNIGASSASQSGNMLTLNLALSFSAAYNGTKNLYMDAQNATQDSGWSSFGTWTVSSSTQTASPLAPVSVIPNTGSGSSQTFAFVFSDPNGATDIASSQIDIASTLSVSGACYLYYPRAFNEIFLASDAGVWQGPITLGSTGTLQNSQCSVNAAASSATASGNTLTLNLALTFTAAFSGTKNIYMETRNASQDVGWSQLGTWTVSSAVQTVSPLAPVSVTPNTGSGASQTFAFVFSDSAGAFDITSAQVDIASTLSVSGACYVYYPRALNELYLASDSGVWQGPIAIGSAGTLHNSQCTLNAGASSASQSGNMLTLNLALSFSAAYNGTKNLYMDAQNATQDSGWSSFGTWTVSSSTQAASPAPVPVSVTPSSGSGLTHTFAFTFSDGSGAADIQSAQIDIAATLSVSGACYIYYVRSLNELFLADDTGTWQGPLKLGASGTLQNSQCILRPAGATAVLTGNTLTLKLPLKFKSGFTGARKVYAEVRNAIHDSGWSQLGTWTP